MTLFSPLLFGIIEKFLQSGFLKNDIWDIEVVSRLTVVL